MANSSHSRRKPKLEPITLDEMAQDASLTGMVSYLQRAPTEPPLPGMGEHPESGAEPSLPYRPPDAATSDTPHTLGTLHTEGKAHTLGETLSIGESQTVCEMPMGDAPTLCETDPDALGMPSSDEPVAARDSHTLGIAPTLSEAQALGEMPRVGQLQSLSESRRGQYPTRIHPLRTAQDGHSLGEQAVYDALWREAYPEGSDSSSRVVSIGYERLAHLARLHWTNVKKNLRSLEQKLAIETLAAEKSGERVGRTYRVYSYREILDRRRMAGLVWYRKRRGVELLTLAQADESHTLGHLHTVGDLRRLSASHNGLSPRPLESKIEKIQESSSSMVVEALRSHAPDVDDLAARMLIAECRRIAADATDEEIVYFIHAKAGQPGVRKPLGFLLTAVPRCFEGEDFRQFRDEQKKGREEELRRKQLYREEARAVLEDPEAGEEEQRWAREMLAPENAPGITR